MHGFDLDRIGAGLPVAAARAELERAARTGAMVVTAPPGTGKTTFVPPLIANLIGADPEHRVLLTQPRRVAVRAAAMRIAELSGAAGLDGADSSAGRPGGAVGFTVRGERKVSADTRLEALTPGVLLRRLIADPALEGVGAVILDEVHERSVEGDLLLGIMAEARALRDDLLVVAMSATLDAEGISELLGDGSSPVPVVDIPSALHPLRIEHAAFDGPRLDERGTTRGYLAHLAAVAAGAQREQACDALVFVPGAREVDETVGLLRDRVGRAGAESVEVLPLHGRLAAKDQDRAVSGRAAGDPPRIVVSTALAESSLTVPGVRLVIDSGLSREVRRDRGRDMAGLVTVSSSRASAEQRAGRAARQGPGRAIRVYSEADLARMPAASAPAIASADLTDAALLMAAWGTPGGEGLALPSPPPRAAMRAAVEVLRTLGLVENAGGDAGGDAGSGPGRITALGRRVAVLPVGAREARALVEGAALTGDARLTAEIVAAMTDDHRDAGADLTALMRALRSGRARGSDRWRREARRLERIVVEEAGPSARRGAAKPDPSAPGIVVALARPEWIARRAREHSRTYLLASGTRAALPEGSPLAGSEWIAVRDVQRAEGRAADGTGAVIRLAAPISEGEALSLGGALLVGERAARIEGGRVRVREERRLGAILLSSSPASPRPEDAGPAFATHLREAGLSALRWTEGALALRARLALLHRELGEPWPAVDDEALLSRLSDWLTADLERLRPDASLHGIDVAAALRRLLPWPEAARLDELAPERIAVPSGSSVRVDYPETGDGPPVAAVKLQEVFGLAETPRVMQGRVPVLFHLLSPARRPLAVTDDLASFWNGPYQQVRKEMRGRYPKHPWPEDPWTARATARAGRGLRD